MKVESALTLASKMKIILVWQHMALGEGGRGECTHSFGLIRSQQEWEDCNAVDLFLYMYLLFYFIFSISGHP